MDLYFIYDIICINVYNSGGIILKKYKFLFLFSLILIVIVFYVYNVKASTDNLEPHVNVYIEGYDKTIAYDEVNAYTFADALKKTTKNKNIDIMIQQDGNKAEIYSIDGIMNNKFTQLDKWYGYIVRNNTIIEQEKYLNLKLQNNDDIILYYGDLNKTEKIIDIYSEVDDNIASNVIQFKIRSQYTKWNEKDGKWTASGENKSVEDVKIYVSTPKNNVEVITDVNGQANIELDGTGVYSYYAEGYRNNDVPVIVKTKKYYSVYGINNEDKITRAEAVSFLVNYCKIENNNDIKYEFNDILNDKHYEEINTAVSNGIINGYSDSTFKPNKNITFLELGIMLYNIYGEEDYIQHKDIKEIPQWAQKYIGFVVDKGFFDGINIEWNHSVNSDDILKLYFNLNLKGMI